MKKIALTILLTIPLILRILFASEVSLLEEVGNGKEFKQEKQKDWEFVKENLFENSIYRENVVPRRIKSPILFQLQGAVDQDSLAVSSVIKELQEILPTKIIDWYGVANKQGNKASVKIQFENNSTVNKRGADEAKKQLYFSFTQNTSLEEKIKYVQYEVLKTICYAHKEQNELNFLNLNYPVNAVFNDPVYNVQDKEITAIDKFLIQKLYAEDFIDQFSDYMHQTYPWKYASLFVNKNKHELKIFLLIGCLCVLMTLLSFSVLRKFTASFEDYFIAMLTIFIGVVNMHWLYVYFIEIQHPAGVIDQTIYLYSILWFLSLAASLVLWFLENKMATLSLNFSSLLCLRLMITLLVLTLANWLGSFVLTDESLYAMPNQILLFYVFLVLTLARGLFIYLNHYSQTIINQKEVELSKMKEINTRNELKSLHARINPHFLYNALNSISGLIGENPEKAEETILGLSDLFRYSINRTNKNKCTIEDEVVMVENYLKIEKIRFGNRLQYTIAVEQALLNKEIPMFLIQPLIENAIKHGIAKSKEGGSIGLEISNTDTNLIISVTDTGQDFPEDIYGGYGFQCICDLLRIHYGEASSFTWANQPDKKITITIPL